MSIDDALNLQPGDMVHAASWEGDPPQEVDSVNHANFPVDPVVFFKKGGFWRSSQLVRVVSHGR